ncbi:unnamed protein product [Heterobilharzia americana]|nr:unnamed protein product [Heterobilharzia americana]
MVQIVGRIQLLGYLPAKDMKEDGQVSNLSNQPTNLPQGLRLVRIVRNADGGTNIVPLSASDIIPKTVESNANNKTAESQITVSLTGTEQESASKLNPSDGIRVILNSNNGLSNVVNLPKSSVVPTDLHEIQPTIMYASFPSVSVGNESVNTPLQPITISTASSQVGFRLTDLITPVTVSNPVLLPSSHQPLTVNICSTDKLKTPTANTAVRFVIAPTANSLGLTNSTQMPTVTVVKASNQSDLPTDSTKVASTTSSLPPLLPRKPPAILRRTLAGPSPSLLLSVSSSNDQIVSQPMRAPSVASLVATNTARQLVCGGFNRYIPTGPARPMISDSSTVLDPQQGRRSISKAQLTRNTPLVDEDPRFLSDPKVFVSEYQGTFRQFVPTVKLQTPIIDEAARALDRAVAEANAKLESINAQMASVRSDAHGLETQIKSLKSELSKYQEIVNRISPAVSAPYSLSLYNSADFDLNNKAFVNKFFRCNKKTNIADVPEDSDSHLAVLPKSLPFVNSYSWPENDCVQSQSFNDKQKQNIVIPKSNLFRLNPRNLRLAILFAGRREIPGYDVEKKRLSQVNWLYPSSRPNFAECWRFRLSQIRIGRCGRDNISFGLDLANFALLLRTLWHCIRWDDILAEPEEDSHTLDSSGRPCFKKTLNHEDDDDNDDNVGGGFSGRQDDMPYSVRRIVEIQPLDRFWLQANYKLRITTTRPNRSYAGRRRKAAGISDHSVRGRSARGSSLHDSPEFEESAPRRKGRRTGQKNGQTGKDPDYDPAVDEGWRVGIPCSTTSGRRQPRNNGRSYGRSNRGSFYDSEDDDQNGDFNSSRRGFQSQRHEVTVEEKWMSEDAVFPWEIRVFMNALLPPKSSYPPVDNNSDSKADYSRKNQYIISARLASLPPGPSPDESNTTAMQNNLVLSSANTECCMEKDGFLYGQSKAVVSNSTSSRRSALASALQFGRTPGSSRNRTDEHSINNIPRPLSPNTLEAKARARSIAATNAARASVAARRARFERALLEQRVRSLKSQFCSRKRLIFNWAKSLADIAVNEIKGAHLGTKTEQPIEDPVEVEQKTLHHIAKKSTVRRGRPPVSRPKSPTILQKKKPGRPKSTVHNDSKNALNNKKSKRKISSISSLSSGEENVNPDSDPLTDYTDAGDQEIEPEWTPAGPTSHLKSASNRPPRKSALNHEFIKSTKNSALKTIQSVKCPDRSSKASLAIKASLKESNKSLASEKDSDVTSCCSTPSTSPGLGDYDNCQQKSEVISQKSVVKDRASQSYPKKTKKSRHESSNSDASGRNDNVSVRVKSPHSSSAGGSNRGRGGGGGRRRGRPKSTDESDKNEAPSELTVNIPRSVPSSPSSAAYCICKTPYDPLREYIGCDLCRDWFHFECVGLDSKDADKLGDSWHCPDCKQAELQANEMLYCVCRTPYEPTRVYIACDGCDEWYHPECVGLTPEEAVNHPDTYLCPACRESSQRKSSITTKKLSGRSKKSKLSSSDEAEYTDQPGANTIYATHLTSDRIEGLVNLIEEIKKHKMSWPFITTPDPVKFPVAQSLDDAFNLPSVISNLKTGVYKTLGDFSFDMNRLFASSRLIYPKDTPEFNCTEIVEALFVQKMKQFKETL